MQESVKASPFVMYSLVGFDAFGRIAVSIIDQLVVTALSASDLSLEIPENRRFLW